MPFKKIKNFKIKKYGISNAKSLLNKIEMPENFYNELFKIMSIMIKLVRP